MWWSLRCQSDSCDSSALGGLVAGLVAFVELGGVSCLSRPVDGSAQLLEECRVGGSGYDDALVAEACRCCAGFTGQV